MNWQALIFGVSARITELRKTMVSLTDIRRYARPELESRIDSISRDLDKLGLEMRRGVEDLYVKSPAAFTETEIQLFMVRLTSLTEAEDNIFADKIVASLNYDSRPVRHGSVPQAHKDTFQWAFDSRLSQWLRCGSGIFWVSGKPGSGKSTFMKFIASHGQTKELLASWSGSVDKLAVAAHFFWIAGTTIQKSWQGLLQSLLFDVLRKHPTVIPLISPNRWAAIKAGQWQTAVEPWSVTELMSTLRALASTKNMPLKICFFIDGLDEYNSDHLELCNVLHDMAGSPHIKMCLSSRPWAVFENSFGGDSKRRLDIHELTRNDIWRFVSDQLQGHPRWAAEASKEADAEKAKLVEQIAANAHGVFLWAFFVTRLLQEDLSAGIMILDLHKRVSVLPRDLEQLFKHILQSVAPIDHPKMAGVLQTAAYALEPLHIDLYWQVEKEFEEHNYAYSCPIGTRSLGLMLNQRENMSRGINGRTKGLLTLVDQRVEFLHRTVKDFILTRDMGDYLRGKLPADYNGFTSIATAYLGFLKTTSQNHALVGGIVRQGLGLNSGPFISHLNQALMYASEALKVDQQVSCRQITALLNEYEAAITEMVRVGHVTIRGFNSQNCDTRVLFREELVRHDFTLYITKKLQEEPDFFGIFDEPPLYAALTPMSIGSGESSAPVLGVIDVILRFQGNPNITLIAPTVSDTVSPWVIFARGVMSVFNMLSGPCMFPALRFNDSLNNGLFELLLSYGAYPNQPLLNRRGAHTVFSHFLDISLSRFLGTECFDSYLRTMDAFLRAGASLSAPIVDVTDTEGLMAFGNLARPRPDESLLASYCTELKTLQATLGSDPVRAGFISSVTEKLIINCSSNKEDLAKLAIAISASFSKHIKDLLLRLVECELAKQGSYKRRRESLNEESSDVITKHLRFERT